MLKEETGAFSEDKTYLTQLATPSYYTLKHNNNTLSRIYYGSEEKAHFYTGEDFYNDMEANSSNNGVYDLLHNNLDAHRLDEAVEKGLFVTHKKKLPPSLATTDLLHVMDGTTIGLDNYFEEDGLVVVNVEKLAKIPDSTDRFVDVADKQGNKFIEVLFKDDCNG